MRLARQNPMTVLLATLLVAIFPSGLGAWADCEGMVTEGSTSTTLSCLNPCAANCGTITSAHPDPGMASQGWTHEACFCNGDSETICCHMMIGISPQGAKFPQAFGKCRPQDATCPPGSCTLIQQIGEGGTENRAACLGGGG